MTDLHDPRVLFAAERTALAWNRTALTLMAFGFAIERFGLFTRLLVNQAERGAHRGISFWAGLAFILMGGFFSATAARQYRNLLKTLQPADIPARYNPGLAFLINVVVALLAAALIVFLILSAF